MWEQNKHMHKGAPTKQKITKFRERKACGYKTKFKENNFSLDKKRGRGWELMAKPKNCSCAIYKKNQNME